MRKLISTFAMLAIVLSMFGGISYAEDRDAKIVLNNDYVIYESGFMEVSGRIVDEERNSTLTSAENEVELEGYRINASRGRFDLTFRADVGNYLVTGSADTENGIKKPSSANFRVIPEITLDRDTTLNFDFPTDDRIRVQGLFENEDGDDFEDVVIGYVDDDTKMMDGAPIAYASYHDEEAFGFLFDGEEFDKTGTIGIFVVTIDDEVLALEGEVEAEELDVEYSSNEIPRGIVDYILPFYFDISDTYLDDDDDLDGYEIEFSIDELGWEESYYSFEDVDDQKIEVEFDADDTENWDIDDYDMDIELKDGTNVISEKTISIEVVRPDDYTLINWSLDKATVGDIEFSFPNSSEPSGNNAEYPTNDVDQKIQVKDDTGYDMRFFEVEVDGAGIEQTFKNFGDNKVDGDIHTITLNETGDLDITIKVYSSGTASSPVETFSRTVEVAGFNVSINPQEVQADSRDDIVITITDEDGVVVNNALVYINNIKVVDGNRENIQNGRYIYEDDEEEFFETVGGLDVEIRAWLEGKYVTLTFNDAIQVVGDEVYTVTSDKNSLVNGFEDTIYITTRDGSEEIYPDLIERIDVNEDGELSTPVALSGRGYEDLDDDGVREAVELELTPNNNQRAIIIRTSTDDGKNMGEVRIEVTSPEVEMLKAEKATENFWVDFEFSALDPRDNSELDSNIYLVADEKYVDYSVEDEDGDSITVRDGESYSISANRDDVYEFSIYVDDVDWDKAEDDEYDVYISVYAESSGDEDIKLMDIPVEQAILKSDPEGIMVGTQSQTFTFTYTNANGTPLEGYELYLNDDEIGETDEDGKLAYNTASAGMTLTLEGETDDDDDEDTEVVDPSDDNEDTIYTEYKIKAMIDATGPVASAPATVRTNTVLITIKDNSAVNKVMINGEPIDIFFARPEITELYTGLKQGDNKITVQATDINNNYSQTVLNVTYVTETSPGPGEVQLTVGKTTQYGVPELMNGTTMVPARFVEELGVTFEFDPQTKTATYKYGDNTVSVTNNRSTAIVNGTQVLMTEQAYINQQGRFMVPLRMVGEELGFTVTWVSNTQPITISK